MEYQPDAGHRGEASDLIYLQNGQQYHQPQQNVGYYQGTQQFHQFVDKKYHELGFGRPGDGGGAGQEMFVPACPGSGSSECSDEGLLRYACPEPFLHQETPRCDSSRSEAGESTCSSMSSGSGTEEGLVRVPLLFPQGFAPGYLPQPGLVRVGQTNGLRLVKPGEPMPGQRGVCDPSVYYVRPQLDVGARPAAPAFPPQQTSQSVPLQAVPVGWRRLLVDNSIIYLT